MNNPFSLIDKTILVTGSSSGIGRSIAIECAKMGAKLIITGRNKERLQETFLQLEGQNHVSIEADLSVYQDIEKLVMNIPKVDGCVLNAGIFNPVILKLSEKNDIDNIININTLAPMYITQLMLSEKKIKKNASIVFISSVAGVFCGAIGGTAYGASKGAIQGFVKSTALELSPMGIRVNTINPGMIETNILDSSSISDDQLQEDIKKYPLKRYGKPSEVAYATIYLLSDAASWVTGSSLLIDGGYTLQ